MALNEIWMLLLLRLKDPKYKDLNIWLRLRYVFRFYFDSTTNRIEFEVFDDFRHETDVNKIKLYSEKNILLYDVQEKEIITRTTSLVPMLISTSARDFKSNYPGIAKSVIPLTFLMEPYTNNELQAALHIFKTVGKLSPWTADTFMEAAQSKGNVLRNILSKSQIAEPVPTFTDIQETSPLSIPSTTNQLVGLTCKLDVPEVKSIADILCNSSYWKLFFLSPRHAEMVAKCVMLPLHVSFMEKYGLAYQLQETIATYALYAEFPKWFVLHKCWYPSSWEFYRNADISNAKRIEFKDEFKNWPKCTSYELFPNMYLLRNFKYLRPNVVYHSSLHNGALYDLFACTLDENKKFHLHFFQLTELEWQDHKFTLHTLLTVLEGLEIIKYEAHDKNAKTAKSTNESGSRKDNDKVQQKLTRRDKLVIDDSIGSINFHMVNSSNVSQSRKGISVTIDRHKIPLENLTKSADYSWLGPITEKDATDLKCFSKISKVCHFYLARFPLYPYAPTIAIENP